MTYSASTGNDESWLKWSRYFHRICWNFLPSAKVNDCWKPMDSVRRLGNIIKATILVKESRYMTMVYFASHHWSKERICCVSFLRMFPNLCWLDGRGFACTSRFWSLVLPPPWLKSYCFQACSDLHHTRWWWRCLTRQKLENLPVRQRWSWIFCGDLTKSGQIMSNLTKQNAGSYTCVSGHVDLSSKNQEMWILCELWIRGELRCLVCLETTTPITCQRSSRDASTCGQWNSFCSITLEDYLGKIYEHLLHWNARRYFIHDNIVKSTSGLQVSCKNCHVQILYWIRVAWIPKMYSSGFGSEPCHFVQLVKQIWHKLNEIEWNRNPFCWVDSCSS